MHQFPKEKRLDWSRKFETTGRMGMVEAAHSVLEFHGAGFDFDELAVASSAAVANYVFDPDLNGHEDQRRLYSPYANYFTNYGVFESLSHYTGWEFGELNGLSQNDAKKLVMFELAAERPLLTYGVASQMKPQVIYGYRRDSTDFDLEIQSLAENLEHHFSDAKLQAKDEVYVNYAVIVREDDREWHLEPERQRMALLRWAHKHWTASREFFHETRENYAPGLAGVETFGKLLREFSTADEWGFASEHVAETRRARSSMSTVFARWAEPIGTRLGAPQVSRSLERVSEISTELVDALGEFDASNPGGWDRVVELERAWVDELSTIVGYLPSAFG